MEGKADIADGAGLFLFPDPLKDSDGLELFPHGDIRHMVHQIIVDMIGP